VSAQPPSGPAVTYKYDALGRRVERREGSSQWTRFAYGESDVVRDRDSGGGAVEYLNGPGADNKLRQADASGALYFLSDHLRSTTALTNALGSVVEQTGYDSFGDSAGGTLTRYGFTGRERDPATGMLYYRARWYDPPTGRFMSEDPAGFAAGVNFYAYVLNDPISKVDPMGLDAAPYYFLSPSSPLRARQSDCGCNQNSPDVETIMEVFDMSVYRMTINGQRHPNPYWNNFWSTFGAGYLGCGLQADVATGDLERNRDRYLDNWHFTIVDGFVPLYHQWGEAVSDNPSNPVIIYDPWKGKIRTECRCNK
jgi:RHS repeat-associated protein